MKMRFTAPDEQPTLAFPEHGEGSSREPLVVRDMYESFFGLKREPFSVAPDPHFLYMSKKHREALSHLVYGLRRGSGFVLLTGEIGAGKTTVWRCFLEQLPPHFEVAYVVNPKLGVDALLTRVCEDLQIEVTADLIDAIHGHLLLAAARGKRTLIVVDEAQALSVEVMEQLRLLTNLDTSGTKLQVLLIGQPELRTMLERPALEPLAQRVVARFHLPALAEAETAQYVAHRLSVAGLTRSVPFDDAALKRIHRLSGGVPRRINVLCDRALVGAHASELHQVDRHTVDRAAAEMFGRNRRSKPRRAPPLPVWLVGAGVAGGVLAAGVLLAPLILPSSTPLVASLLPAANAPAVVPATDAAAVPAPTLVARPAPEGVAASARARVIATAPAAAAVTPPRTITTTVTAPPTVLAAAPPAGVVAPGSLDAVLATAWVDEAQSWRALAGLWGARLDPGDPCSVAPLQSLNCFRSRGGLGPIRQLGRPGILKLADEHGRTAYVLLTALTDDSATLRVSGFEHTVPLAQLARAWRGEFATFWRAPPGYRSGEGVASGRITPWIMQRLALIDGAASLPLGNEALRSRIFAFQLARGLEPDGVPGPLTMMQLNRASGVEEPVLQGRR